MHGNAAIERTLDEIGGEARAEAAFILGETLGHRREVPFHHVRHAAAFEHVVMGQAIGHLRRHTRPGLPFAQRLRREWRNLEHPSFGDAVVDVPVVIIGAIADDLHLQADLVLEVFERRRRVDRLVEDRRVIAVAHGKPLEIAIAALGRILDAQCARVMIACDPDFAHRQGGDAADLIGALQHERARAMIMGGDRRRQAADAGADRDDIRLEIPLRWKIPNHGVVPHLKT